MSDAENLTAMGFGPNRVERALRATKRAGLQQALDWLMSHQDDADIDDPIDEATPMDETPTTNPDGTPIQARSLKCNDCGKLLRNEMDAQAHAARTEHSNFSESTDEIKPLTEEEKAAAVEKLKEKIAASKIAKAEAEAKEEIQREKLRRMNGQEMVENKRKLQEDQIKRQAEEKRREKEEEAKARQRVKDQIAKDKADRAARSKPTAAAAPPPTSTAAAAAPAPAVAAPAVEYTEARVQVRLTDGSAITHMFAPNDTIADVERWVAANRTDGSAPFSLMTNFPKKVYGTGEGGTSLRDAGLVPSGVLIVTRK